MSFNQSWLQWPCLQCGFIDLGYSGPAYSVISSSWVTVAHHTLRLINVSALILLMKDLTDV